MIFSSDICSFSRFFITFAPIYRAEKRSKKKRSTKITEKILIINNLNLFLSKIEKAKTSIVPIKTQSADYEICEESASESNRNENRERTAFPIFLSLVASVF